MVEPNFDEPLKSEFEAQDEQTVMPWLWGGVGLLLIALFVAGVLLTDGHHMPEPPGAAPAVKPISQHY